MKMRFITELLLKITLYGVGHIVYDTIIKVHYGMNGMNYGKWTGHSQRLLVGCSPNFRIQKLNGER